MRTWMRLLSLVVLSQLSHAQVLPETGTGSYGDFAPSIFLENQWKVFQAVGPSSRTGFPCDSTGNVCRRSRKYRLQTLTQQQRRGTDGAGRVGIQVGNSRAMGEVEREDSGSYNKVFVKALNDANLARIDGTGASARLGFDGAFTETLTRFFGFGAYQQPETLMTIDSKGAAWTRLNPLSFYFVNPDNANESAFGFTLVDKQMLLGQLQNYWNRTPRVERMREGTFWCQSDRWRLARSTFEGVFKNDEFDEAACSQNMMFKSQTRNTLLNSAQGFFLNRQDSELYDPATRITYVVEANPQWICLFDCDGTYYNIKLGGRVKVKISSDRWNWFSKTRFKIKVVMIDWDNDGFEFDNRSVDLFKLTDNPYVMKDIVAVIVSEIKDVRGDFSSAFWTQNTHIMFPPAIGGGPMARETDHKKIALYQIKLLDGILAMMPDQVQMSPELNDAEEKLDEISYFLRREELVEQMRQNRARGVNDELIVNEKYFEDIYSRVDATTAVTWKRPYDERIHEGKIPWTLNQLTQRY